jgi:hypothetical protein
VALTSRPERFRATLISAAADTGGDTPPVPHSAAPATKVAKCSNRQRRDRGSRGAGVGRERKAEPRERDDPAALSEWRVIRSKLLTFYCSPDLRNGSFAAGITLPRATLLELICYTLIPLSETPLAEGLTTETGAKELLVPPSYTVGRAFG